MSQHRTLAGIARDLRHDADVVEECHLEDTWTGLEMAGIYRDLADQIEEAAKRELSRAAEDAASKATLDRTAKDAAEYMAYAMAHSAPQSGDAAALREALEEVKKDLWELMGSSSESFRETRAEIMSRRIRAALSAPARNCDVGTAEEQAKRFFAFCHAHRMCDTACSDNCPFKATPDINHCQSGWGQLPYDDPEKPETKGEADESK